MTDNLAETLRLLYLARDGHRAAIRQIDAQIDSILRAEVRRSRPFMVEPADRVGDYGIRE